LLDVGGLHDAHRTRILRVIFAWHMRQIHAGCVSHPRIGRKCCAHLPRATRDVTFGLLCNAIHLVADRIATVKSSGECFIHQASTSPVFILHL
jgi:hypothetical protein